MMHVIIGEDLHDRDYVGAAHAGLRRARRARRRTIRRRRSRRSAASPPAEVVEPRARVRRGEARRRSGSTTACSATPAAAWRRARSRACRRWSARGAIPPAASLLVDRATSTAWTTRRSSVPTCIRELAAHDQPVDARRRAARRRPAGQGGLRLQQQPGRGLPRLEQGDRRLLARPTSSPSCTRSSSPTPATTPTSCCRRPRSSSTSTSTSRTGTSTSLANSPAIAPLGEAKPNIEVFRLLAKRMGFTDACFDDTDEDVVPPGAAVRQPAHERDRLGHR